MPEQKSNQPSDFGIYGKSATQMGFCIENNIPFILIKMKEDPQPLSDSEYSLYVEYAKYDPYLIQECRKCRMPESCCICSQYDREGNEI